LRGWAKPSIHHGFGPSPAKAADDKELVAVMCGGETGVKASGQLAGDRRSKKSDGLSK
jgi:hypothetical protein